MEKREFGKTGMKVSVLGFGGAEVGFSNASADRVKELLVSALDAGLNVIDTAECYETSEELIGKAVAGRRKDFYLFTKCGHSHGYSDPDWHDMKRLEASLDRSLKRLGTDYVDLFQLHSCSKDVLEKGDVIEFMKKAKKSGKTRFIGYSGDNEEALYAVHSGVFDALQTSLSIADQWSLEHSIPEAMKRGMGVITKRPIANAAWRHKEKPVDNSYIVPYWERLQKLDYNFLKGDMGKAVSEALRFTLTTPGVTVAIVGTQQPGRWQENAKIVGAGHLEAAYYNAIRKRWREIAQPDWKGEI